MNKKPQSVQGYLTPSKLLSSGIKQTFSRNKLNTSQVSSHHEISLDQSDNNNKYNNNNNNQIKNYNNNNNSNNNQEIGQEILKTNIGKKFNKLKEIQLKQSQIKKQQYFGSQIKQNNKLNKSNLSNKIHGTNNYTEQIGSELKSKNQFILEKQSNSNNSYINNSRLKNSNSNNNSNNNNNNNNNSNNNNNNNNNISSKGISSIIEYNDKNRNQQESINSNMIKNNYTKSQINEKKIDQKYNNNTNLLLSQVQQHHTKDINNNNENKINFHLQTLNAQCIESIHRLTLVRQQLQIQIKALQYLLDDTSQNLKNIDSEYQNIKKYILEYTARHLDAAYRNYKRSMLDWGKYQNIQSKGLEILNQVTEVLEIENSTDKKGLNKQILMQKNIELQKRIEHYRNTTTQIKLMRNECVNKRPKICKQKLQQFQNALNILGKF